MLRNAFWVLSLFVLGLYAFFVVLGAWDPIDVLPLTIAMVVLAALWVAHAWLRHRHADEVAHDPRAMRARASRVLRVGRGALRAAPGRREPGRWAGGVVR